MRASRPLLSDRTGPKSGAKLMSAARAKLARGLLKLGARSTQVRLAPYRSWARGAPKACTEHAKGWRGAEHPREGVAIPPGGGRLAQAL